MSDKEEKYYKQVIVARKDLNMRKGKLAAQVAHASRGAANYAQMEEDNVGDIKDEEDVEPIVTFWEFQGETKIVVGIEGEGALIELYKEVNEAGIPTKLIKDRGHTELEPGTPTAVGIGPAEIEEIDEYTSHLELL